MNEHPKYTIIGQCPFISATIGAKTAPHFPRTELKLNPVTVMFDGNKLILVRYIDANALEANSLVTNIRIVTTFGLDYSNR